METIHVIHLKRNSVVKMVRYDKKLYVAKIYFRITRQVLIETNILATTSHRNIVSMVRLLAPISNNPIGILLPKLGRSLTDVLETETLSLGTKIDYLLQIAYGIRYLHHNQIVHLDLKTDNIMVTKGQIHLIDFDMAEYLYENKGYTENLKCTATHRPPEGALHEEDVRLLTDRFDIWSFGIIIYEILTGKPIYLHPEMPDDHEQIHQFVLSKKIQEEIYQDLPDIFKSCLEWNPSHRPHIDHVILNLYIFQTQKDIVNKKIYDITTDLRILRPVKLDEKFYGHQYYSLLLKKIAEEYPNHVSYYPKIIITATYDLLHRLTLVFGSLRTEMIIQAILFCHAFITEGAIIPIKELLDEVNDPVLGNQIVLATNGILFNKIIPVL